MSETESPIRLLGPTPKEVERVRSILGAGHILDDHRGLKSLRGDTKARAVFVFGDIDRAVAGGDDAEAALARWNDALEALYDAALDPGALERVFPLYWDWLIAPQPDYLRALLAFVGLPATAAMDEALRGAADGERTGRPLSDSQRSLVDRHARRDLARAAVGFAADARLRFSSEPPTVPIRELATMAHDAHQRLLSDKNHALALREWRIGRLLVHRRGASKPKPRLVESAAKLSEAIKQGRALGRAVAAKEAPAQLGARAKSAWRLVERARAAEGGHGWQTSLEDGLARCAAIFRLPGGKGGPFAFTDGSLVSVDGKRAYAVRDDAVRARPADVKLVRGLAAKPPPPPPTPPETLALDVGTKSGDGFLTFLKAHADQVGVDPDSLDAVIGVDLNQIKLSGAVDTGIVPVLADGSRLPFADGSFDVAVGMELLEHVPPKVALGIVREMRRVSRRAIFIQNPDFTEEAYLAELGLKFSWMGWREHCHHITRDALQQMLRESGYDASIEVERVRRVKDSSHPLIVPLSAPPQTKKYSKKLGAKPMVRFDRPVFQKLRVVVTDSDQ